jgi:hypothetical protein
LPKEIKYTTPENNILNSLSYNNNVVSPIAIKSQPYSDRILDLLTPMDIDTDFKELVPMTVEKESVEKETRHIPNPIKKDISITKQYLRTLESTSSRRNSCSAINSQDEFNSIPKEESSGISSLISIFEKNKNKATVTDFVNTPRFIGVRRCGNSTGGIKMNSNGRGRNLIV